MTNPSHATARIGIPELLSRLASSEEHSLVDVREEGAFGNDGHILLAVCVPLSQLELRFPVVIPRKSTRVVLTDGGDGVLSARAAHVLAHLGYSDVVILDGGLAAWKDAGREVFTGLNVVSKAFGEHVEHVYATPRLGAEELQALLSSGRDVAVLDSRTPREFHNMSIPGAIGCEGAELVRRAHEAITSPETIVVVNCAGRTRSIIGAQSLINAGIANPVFSLENGTMAWLMAGYELDHGKTLKVALPSAENLARSRAAADALVQRFGLEQIDTATLDRLRGEGEQRSLYLLDVRTEEEYLEGHLPGAAWAVSGQLVQALDRWVATRNARIVLVDDEDGIRAAVAASWIRQIGWGEVFIHKVPTSATTEKGAGASVAASIPQVPTIAAADLAAGLKAGGLTLIDLAPSSAYAAGHIAGAQFAIRAKLSSADLPAGHMIVLTSPDGVLARFAAADLIAEGHAVSILEGGTAAWSASPLVADDGLYLHEPDDVFVSAYQKPDRFKAFQEYLDWEVGLLEQLERDGTLTFPAIPQSPNFDAPRARQAEVAA